MTSDWARLTLFLRAVSSARAPDATTGLHAASPLGATAAQMVRILTTHCPPRHRKFHARNSGKETSASGLFTLES